MDEIKLIQPKWAFGADIDKLLHKSLNPSLNEYIMSMVDVVGLIKCADFEEVKLNSLFDSNVLSNQRISRILNRWRQAQFVDPPEVYLSGNNLKFADGRHRAKLTFFMGQKLIPIAYRTEDLEQIMRMMRL